MNLKTFVLLLLSQLANASVLLWSTKHIQIPSLKYFNEEDFQMLLRDLENPEIVAFQNDFPIIQNIPSTPENFYSVYIPNGNMYIENVTVFTEDSNNNLNMIKEKVSSFEMCTKHKNLLVVISSPNIRVKRDASNTTESTYLNEKDLKGPTYLNEKDLKGPTYLNEKELKGPTYLNEKDLKGPVLYSAKGKAMIYSSKPLILRTPSENYTLGNTLKVSMISNPTFDLLAATIEIPKTKKSITLKFKFQYTWGYWSLQTVRVDVEGKLALLNESSSVGAENNYSFHCFGETVFKGGDMELILYDIQVQPYTKNGRFSSAYSCVGFTTVAIWSGLMVSFMLILGLFLGLGMLANIKTMDKFDNSKTKQLSFIISE